MKRETLERREKHKYQKGELMEREGDLSKKIMKIKHRALVIVVHFFR